MQILQAVFMMLRRLSLFLFAVLALTTSWSCSGANSAGVLLQGIRGTATLRLNPSIPGPPPVIRPLPNAVISVQPEGGSVEVGRAIANANGEFEIRLPVGTCLIVPLLPNPNNSPVTSLAPNQTVVVRANEFTTVNLEYRSDAP